MSIDPLSAGVSGLNAYGTQVDVSANNIANVNTAGFQSQEVSFQSVLGGVAVGSISTNPAPGGLQPTGSATSLAISGHGFFVLQGSGAPTYTRAGNFTVGANGTLVDSASGIPVAGTAGQAITVPPNVSNVTIGADGTVAGVLPNGQATSLGRIALATFGNPGGLLRDGGGYQASAASGDAQLGAPATAGYGSLEAGFLEDSNVNLGDEFVKMMAAQTAFEANAKTIHAADQDLGTIVNLGSDQGKTT